MRGYYCMNDCFKSLFNRQPIEIVDFDLWGKPVWPDLHEEISWQEKYSECGFTVEFSEKSFYRKLNKEDNELGEQADKFGIDIGLKFTLYILRKFV